MEKPIYYDDLDIKLQLGDLNVNVLYLRYEPPSPLWHVSYHFHSSFELHFIPGGRGFLNTGRDTHVLESGTFYLTGPDVFHEQETDKSFPMAEFALSLELDHARKEARQGSKCAYNEGDIIADAFYRNSFWIGKDEYSNMTLFEKIFRELEKKHVGYYYNVKSLIAQIVVNSARNLMTDKVSSSTPPMKLADDKRRFILDFFFGECYKTLTFNELAARLGVSKRQLDRIIRQHYGICFKGKLLETRLRNARHLLENTSLPIEKILENTGFATAGHFYRAFKRCQGMTPAEYRNMSKESSGL